MLIFSFNKSRGAKIAVISALAVFLTALCIIIALEKKSAVPDYIDCDGIGRYFTEASDTEAQQKFLGQFGLKADVKSKNGDTVVIPSEFSEVYEEYNELQQAVGLDLKPFRGREVERIVFKLKNRDRFATLLVFKGHVIGGHLATGVFADGYEALNTAS